MEYRNKSINISPEETSFSHDFKREFNLMKKVGIQSFHKQYHIIWESD